MSDLDGRRLVHVTTTDMSLALLLGPQLRAFAAHGLEVIGVSAPGPFVDQLSGWGIAHVPLRHATRSVSPGHDLMALPELERLFRHLRPDIVHTHNPKPGIYGRLAARAAGVPGIVNTVHGLYAAPEDRRGRKAVVYALERMASTCSQKEFFQNPEDLEVMRRWGVPARKLELLGNGVDLVRLRPPRSDSEVTRARATLGVDTSSVVVGMVGRLVWQKGFRELFAAARQVRETCPEVVFAIVGPEDEAKGDALDSRDITEARALGNMVFCGHRDDVENLYRGFDLFVLPSYREGFPRSAMEAAASGLPIIATDIRGCRQVVEHRHNGLLVPIHDADNLAAAIVELARDAPARSVMGARSRQKAEAEFDDGKVIDKTLAAYRRLPDPSPSWTRARMQPGWRGDTG
jgi:glycosyltransferase involved in cell wall biosynthesis